MLAMTRPLVEEHRVFYLFESTVMSGEANLFLFTNREETLMSYFTCCGALKEIVLQCCTLAVDAEFTKTIPPQNRRES